MKKATKLLLTVLAMLVLAAGAAAGTYAYLTDTDKVVNTFTVGKIDITLDEAQTDTAGVPVTPAKRVKGNEYHLLPGLTYTKDPTVTVLADSTASYVRMMVTVENMEALKLAFPAEKYPAFYSGGVFLLQKLCLDENGASTWDSSVWPFHTYHADSATYEFRYQSAVPAVFADTKLAPLFEAITVPGALTNEEIARLNKVKLHVTAHAIQADGFDTAEKAWAAFGPWTPPAGGGAEPGEGGGNEGGADESPVTAELKLPAYTFTTYDFARDDAADAYGYNTDADRFDECTITLRNGTFTNDFTAKQVALWFSTDKNTHPFTTDPFDCVRFDVTDVELNEDKTVLTFSLYTRCHVETFHVNEGKSLTLTVKIPEKFISGVVNENTVTTTVPVQMSVLEANA